MSVSSVEMRCPKCKRTLEHAVIVGPNGQLTAICRHTNCRHRWSYEGTLVSSPSVYNGVVTRRVAPNNAIPTAVTAPAPAKPDPPRTYTEFMKQVFNDYIRPLKPDYQERAIQLQLAGQIYAAYTKNRILLAEAGVGTGKSFAYLAPAFYLLRKGRGFPQRGPVIISTRTVNLMDQMIGKDIPFVRKAFANDSVFLPETAGVAVMKGQRHYVCLKRLYSISLGFLGPAKRDAILQWAGSTLKGDRSDEVPKALTDEQWQRINVAECDADSCRFRDECPFLRARGAVRGQVNGIIVTNHNLLADHLAKTQRGREGLWISPAAVIIDEAHSLEASFRQQLSLKVSPRTFEQLIKYLEHGEDALDYLSEVDVDALLPLSERFFATLHNNRQSAEVLDDGLQRFSVELTDELKQTLQQLRALVGDLIAAAESTLSNRGFRGSDLDGEERKQRRRLRRVQHSAERVAETLDQFLQVVDGTGRSHAAWLDTSGKVPELVVAPLDVSSLLQSQLWAKNIPVVLTSGTLMGADGFESLIASLGLEENDRVKGFERTGGFDYASRVRIYVPNHLPAPRSKLTDGEEDAFTKEMTKEIGRLLQYSGGRALCLFTSYQRLEATYVYLKTLELPFNILAQGQGNNGALLDAFRNDETSVLLATGAFWEGADVDGESLTLVIMDKLPFPNPQDPLIAALTREAIRKDEDFKEKVYLPTMITMVRQGAGRLIRKESDWGVIAILDRRANRAYRRLLEATLPPAAWTDDADVIRRWFAQHGPDAVGEV